LPKTGAYPTNYFSRYGYDRTLLSGLLGYTFEYVRQGHVFTDRAPGNFHQVFP
jgi:hypothetical protein